MIYPYEKQVDKETLLKKEFHIIGTYYEDNVYWYCLDTQSYVYLFCVDNNRGICTWISTKNANRYILKAKFKKGSYKDVSVADFISSLKFRITPI